MIVAEAVQQDEDVGRGIVLGSWVVCVRRSMYSVWPVGNLRGTMFSVILDGKSAFVGSRPMIGFRYWKVFAGQGQLLQYGDHAGYGQRGCAMSEASYLVSRLFDEKTLLCC